MPVLEKITRLQFGVEYSRYSSYSAQPYCSHVNVCPTIGHLSITPAGYSSLTPVRSPVYTVMVHLVVKVQYFTCYNIIITARA